jgi:hypothetical protein
VVRCGWAVADVSRVSETRRTAWIRRRCMLHRGLSATPFL